MFSAIELPVPFIVGDIKESTVALVRRTIWP